MTRHPLPPPHYVTKFYTLQRRGLIPPDVTLTDIHVFHDAWCVHWGGASCNCDPNLGLQRAAEWKLTPGPLRDV